MLDALAWLPGLALAGTAVVLALTLRPAVHALYLHGDIAAPPVIAEGLQQSGPVHVAVGLNAFYTTFWFDLLTRGLPLHRQLWELAPVLSALIAVALLAWGVHRLAGGWAALATAAAALSMAPAVYFCVMSQGFHGPTYVNIALLGATLTWLGTTRRGPRWRSTVLAAVATVTGLDMASDSLLLPAGVVPFVLAPVLARVPGRADRGRRVASAAAICAAAAFAVGQVGSALVSAEGFHATASSGRVDLSLVSQNAGLLARVLRNMGGGGSPAPSGLLALGIAVLGVTVLGAGLVAVVALALSSTVRVGQRPDAALTVHRYFWAGVVAVLVVAFLATDFPVDEYAVRYLVPLQFAVAAGLPLLAAGRRGRGVVAVAVSLLVLSTTRALAAGTPDALVFPPSGQTDGLTAFLESRHLQYGYAGYWQANSVTWASAERVQSRAVTQGSACGSADPGMLCSYDLNTVLEWYTPVPGRRTFFIRDQQAPALAPNAPSPALGAPVEVDTYDRFTIYVYADDIAAHFTR